MRLGLLAQILNNEDSKWKDSAYARALTNLMEVLILITY